MTNNDENNEHDDQRTPATPDPADGLPAASPEPVPAAPAEDAHTGTAGGAADAGAGQPPFYRRRWVQVCAGLAALLAVIGIGVGIWAEEAFDDDDDDDCDRRHSHVEQHRGQYPHETGAPRGDQTTVLPETGAAETPAAGTDAPAPAGSAPADGGPEQPAR